MGLGVPRSPPKKGGGLGVLFKGILEGLLKGIYKGSIKGLGFPKLGVPYFGVLIIRILPSKVLY